MDLNDLTNENYNKYVQSKAKPSPIGKNLVWAFTVGGLICVLGQGMWDGYHALGLDEKTARTAVSITLIFITALLTGIGVFDSFAKPGRGRWCRSRGLPMQLWRRRWSLGRKGLSQGRRSSSLPWRGRCWCLAFRPA